MRAARRGAAAAAVCAVFAWAACGVPADDDARPIAASDVPFGLLEERPSETTTTVPPQSARFRVFLVRGERLAAVERELHAAGGVGAALAALERGATDTEANTGLRSAVTQDTLDRVAVHDGVASVDLAESFTALAGPEQHLAIAQIVYTATEHGVVSVSFRLDGRPVEVPTDGANLVSRPVDRDDYRTVAPVEA